VLLYLMRDAAGHDMWALRIGEDTAPEPIARGSYMAGHAQFSPDGRWIAYAAQNGAGRDVYVEPYPSTGQRWIVSADGGDQPRWRADGRELIYVSSNRFVMAVDIQTAPQTFRAGVPHRLFEVRLRSHDDDRSVSDELFQYAISGDAQRFLVDTIDDASSPALVRVATNWKSSLQLLERK
jgi:Tol biopolymer transport system component